MSNDVFYHEMTEQLKQALDVLPLYDALPTLADYFDKQIGDRGNIRDAIRDLQEEHLMIVVPGYRVLKEQATKADEKE